VRSSSLRAEALASILSRTGGQVRCSGAGTLPFVYNPGRPPCFLNLGAVTGELRAFNWRSCAVPSLTSWAGGRNQTLIQSGALVSGVDSGSWLVPLHKLGTQGAAVLEVSVSQRGLAAVSPLLGEAEEACSVVAHHRTNALSGPPKAAATYAGRWAAALD